MNRLRLFIVLTVVWIAGAAACFGQASAMNGEISGTVTDPTGSVIANADVNITNLGTGFRQTGKTGDSGLFRFNLLPLGKYELEVEVPGFTPGKRSGIEVNAGASVTVNVPMQVAGSTTQVEVTATGAPTNPDKTDLGATLDNTPRATCLWFHATLTTSFSFNRTSAESRTLNSGFLARSMRTGLTAASITKSMAATTRKAIARASA